LNETSTIETFDVVSVRSQFPILHRTVYDNRQLVYLDSASTSQKPQAVIDAIANFYTQSNSNVHRSAHALSAEATEAFEAGRRTVATFINAARPEEIVFTRGTTESINLVAQTWGRMNIHAGDVVLLTEMEHHANIVPWQMLCESVGASVRVIRVDANGSLDINDSLDALDSLDAIERVKLLAVTHVSNSLGTVNDVKALCAWARSRGIVSVVDGAQAVSHVAVDVQDIGCDFYAFSAHKLYGPTGIGVLYGQYALLDAMPPYQGGGAMISNVTFDKTTYNDVPVRFEAGTPHIEGVIGMAEAIRWFAALNLDALADYESGLLRHAMNGLQAIDGLRVIGTSVHKIGIVSFVVDGVHAADIGALVDRQGVAIRVGHHCNMPLLQCYGLSSTARASFAAYTTIADVDALIAATAKAVRMLR